MKRSGSLNKAFLALSTALLLVMGSGGSVSAASMHWQDPYNNALASRIRGSYNVQTAKAGGDWYSLVTAADSDGMFKPVVDKQSDRAVYGYSVDKVAVALAVMDKVDRGELSLGQKVTLTGEIIAPGSGIYQLQTTYGDNLTVANIITAMLLVSDNTAVRLLGTLVPGPEINQILAKKGFVNTHVDPVAGNPNRFFLGQTTPREMNRLLEGLARKTLLSAQSSDFLLNIMRWVDGYNDGVRRNMSSEERIRVADKYGAFEDSRHEVGIMFDTKGAPVLVYALFNENVGDIDNYGSTNPAVQAEAALGRVMFDAVNLKLQQDAAGL